MRVFVTAGMIAAMVFTAAVVYAAVLEFNKQAVVRTTYIRMGPAK